MLIDIIVDGETVMTLMLKSIQFLLRNIDETDFPIKIDDREVRVRFRKERGE